MASYSYCIMSYLYLPRKNGWDIAFSVNWFDSANAWFRTGQSQKCSRLTLVRSCHVYFLRSCHVYMEIYIYHYIIYLHISSIIRLNQMDNTRRLIRIPFLQTTLIHLLKLLKILVSLHLLRHCVAGCTTAVEIPLR